MIKCSNDSSIAYWFLTYAEYLKECDRDGKNHFIPFECCTFHRELSGHLVALIDEDEHQEYQRRKADEKAAGVARSVEESLNDDGGGSETIGVEIIPYMVVRT